MKADLVGESLNEDGHQQVEQHIVAKGHEGNEVKGGPVRGSFHSSKEHNVPVFLCQHLPGNNGNVSTGRKLCTWNTVTVAQSKESKFFLSQIFVSGSQNLQPKRFMPRMENMKMNNMRRPKKTATLSIVRSITISCRRRFGRKRTSLRILSSRNVLRKRSVICVVTFLFFYLSTERPEPSAETPYTIPL